MSFSHNPYKHIELVYDPKPGYEGESAEKARANPIVVHCHGCGSSRDRIAMDGLIGEAFKIHANHIKKSHGRAEEDFEGWSAY